MGDRGRGRGNDSATRPKQPRGRGRAAPKSDDVRGRAAPNSANPGRGRAAPNGNANQGRGRAAPNSANPGRGRAAPNGNANLGRGRAAPNDSTSPGRGRAAPKNSANPGRGRAAFNSNANPGRGRTEDDGEAQFSPMKEPRKKAAQKRDPKEDQEGAGDDRAVGLYKASPQLLDSLRLKMKDISNAVVKVNPIVNTIIQELSRKERLFHGMAKMSTGSYYEGVKVARPNEFDIMLKIPISDDQRIGLTEFGMSGAFYTLSCKRKPVDFMTNYVDDDGNISGQKILTQFRKLVKEIVSGMPVSVKRKNPSSPALTLIIENSPTNIDVDLVVALEIRQSWPHKTKEGMNIDSWLGKKVKKKFKFYPFYMVPKKCKEGNTIKDTWRISFSHVEKEMLTNHGSSKTCCEEEGEKCCRKQCLKLLKNLLELLKNNGKHQKKLDKICSYYAKTAWFHHCAECPKDEEWKLEDLNICFNRYIQYFQSCLKDAHLPNFFIPSHNLFSMDVDCNLLYNLIDYQIKHNYPLFDL